MVVGLQLPPMSQVHTLASVASNNESNYISVNERKNKGRLNPSGLSLVFQHIQLSV
jgi:hypothetical protein